MKLAALLAAVAFFGLGFGNGYRDHQPKQPNVQTIYVRNLSGFVSDKQVANDIPAFQAATSKDFAPLWNIDAKLVFLGKKPAPRGAAVINLRDRSDVQGALAYHELRDGVFGAEVFVGTSKYYGFSWTVGFTHELWEMLADPGLVRTMQSTGGGWPDGTIWANENADPVEADNLGYTRTGANGKPVLISDFVTEKWFGAETAGPFDFMNHIQKPLQVLKGGYAQWWDGVSWHLIENFRAHSADAHWLIERATR